MKMLIVVYRDFMSDEIHNTLQQLDIKTYSEVPKVFGIGELGRADDSRHGPGHNACLFAALPDDQADQVVETFKQFTNEKQREYGRPIALRAFITPCVQVI